MLCSSGALSILVLMQQNGRLRNGRPIGLQLSQRHPERARGFPLQGARFPVRPQIALRSHPIRLGRAKRFSPFFPIGVRQASDFVAGREWRAAKPDLLACLKPGVSREMMFLL